MVNWALPRPMLHHYLVKTAIVLVIIFAVNLALNVSFLASSPAPASNADLAPGTPQLL